RSAAAADGCVHRDREVAQLLVAGSDLGPGVGTAHDRPGERLSIESDRAEHRARGSPAGTVRNRAALPFIFLVRHNHSRRTLRSGLQIRAVPTTKRAVTLVDDGPVKSVVSIRGVVIRR